MSFVYGIHLWLAQPKAGELLRLVVAYQKTDMANMGGADPVRGGAP